MKSIFNHRNNWIEAFLLLTALCVLWIMAWPFDRLLTHVPEAAIKTVAFYETGLTWFIHLALAGWLALLIGRLPRLPALVNGAVVFAWWLVYWAWLQPIAKPNIWFEQEPLWITVLAVFIVLISFIVAFSLRRYWISLSSKMVSRGTDSVWVYPGFVLFTGIGFIWLMDVLVNGHSSGIMGKTKLLLSATRPIDLSKDWAFAFAIFTLVSTMAPAILKTMLVLGGRFVNLTVKIQLFSYLILALIFLYFLYYFGVKNSQIIPKPLLVEVVRIPLVFCLGYLFFRWLEAGERMAKEFWWGFFAIALLAISGYLVFKENGQTLIITATFILLFFAAGFEYGWNKRSIPRSRFAGVKTLFSSFAALALVVFLLHHFGHMFSNHIGDRIHAMENPEVAREDFLAVLRWFSAESGLTGFGLGQVPWCGYTNNLGELCKKGTGVPFQIDADYAFVGLMGVWGAIGAMLIVVALVWWLLAILHSLLDAQLSRKDIILKVGLLQCWIVGVWVVVILVQIFLTVLGSLGLFVLTGVPLPMMAMGSASILSIAIFAGIANSQVDDAYR